MINSMGTGNIVFFANRGFKNLLYANNKVRLITDIVIEIKLTFLIFSNISPKT